MALPEDGLRAELKGAGWRQGSVIAAADLARLQPLFVCADPAFEIPANPLIIVCSQTCDLVNDTLAVEPVVDLVVGEILVGAEPDIPRLRNQHPRELDLPLQRGTETIYARLYMRKRVALARQHLIGLRPCEQTSLSDAALHGFVLWLRDRFARTALPDEFVRRLRGTNGKNQKKLEQILRGAPEINQLFISLRPSTEIAGDQKYRVVLLGTMKKGIAATKDGPQKAINALRALRANLSACAGIEVLDDQAKSEAEVTLEDIRLFKRFGFEYLSSDPRDEEHEQPELDNGPVL